MRIIIQRPLIATLLLAGSTATAVRSATLFSDDFESYTSGSQIGAPWTNLSNNGGSVQQTVNTNSGSFFGTSTQYLNLRDSTGTAYGSATTPALSGANGTVTTLSFDFHERDLSGVNDPIVVGYDADGVLSSSTARIYITLDDGAIGGTDGSGTTTYDLVTAYQLSIIFNDTSSAVTYGSETLSAFSFDVWIRDLDEATPVFVGTGTAANNAGDYVAGFRTFNSAAQWLYVDNFSVVEGAQLIPEPSSALLGALCLAGACLLRRRGS